MKVINLFSIFILIIKNLIADPCSSANDNNLVFKILNGKLKGSCNTIGIKFSNGIQKNNAVLQWLGLPYAETPIGDLRFKSPLPVKSWSNVKEVKDFNYLCIQPPEIIIYYQYIFGYMVVHFQWVQDQKWTAQN
jgi:para-nitrobenzyl esterase